MGVSIKKNDFVLVQKGKDRGKKGRVIRVFPTEKKALVEGINFVKKHSRRQGRQQSGIVTMEKPISIANISYFCMKCSHASRLGVKMLDDGSRARFCRKCGELLEAK